MKAPLYIRILPTDDPHTVRIQANTRPRLRGRPSTLIRRDDLGAFLDWLAAYAEQPETVWTRVMRRITRAQRPFFKTRSAGHE